MPIAYRCSRHTALITAVQRCLRQCIFHAWNSVEAFFSSTLRADGREAIPFAVTAIATTDLIRVVLAVDVTIASPIQWYAAFLVTLEVFHARCRQVYARFYFCTFFTPKVFELAYCQTIYK